MTNNRSRLARQNAGLSVGQAARLLGVTSEDLIAIEASDEAVASRKEQLADLYRVRVEWLTGEVERYDYETVRGMKGSDDLTDHDRKIIAEFAASMPRKVSDSALALRGCVRGKDKKP